MRKIFTLLLLLAGLFGNGQQYNNEWIKFNQTYYKIKVGGDGVYRIPKSLLDGLGIGNAPVQNFEMWRNGERVPFYPSVPSGALPANGYLEFWGEKNDGKPDKPLYRNPAYQHTDKLSLQTDTAIVFLSVNNDQSGVLVSEVANNVAGNALPVEQYFMYTIGLYFGRPTGLPNLGLGADVGTSVYSSSYDRGEFFSSDDIYPGRPLSWDLNSLKVYNAGFNSAIKFGAAGNAMNARNVRLRINGTVVKDTVMDYYSDLVTTIPVPTSSIASSFHADFDNLSVVTDDRMVISFLEITYPRTPDLNGEKNFKFELPARSAGYFLKFTNFNNGGVPPVLYDLANGERFTGDLSVPGAIQFALPGTANERKLVLVSEDASNITTVTSATPRIFTRYTDVANQGNYLIVSNPLLYTGTAGNNPVVDYKNYRESTAGGGYKVVLADINELVDQFAFGIKKHPLSVRNFIRFARTHFSMQPKFVFLIGRGMVYSDYQLAIKLPGTYPFVEQLNLVPTFGNPASDNLLSAEDLKVPVATTPIGRLSVVKGKEIEDYLEKVKEYDLAQKTAPNTLAGRQWMKNVVHVTGSSDPYLGTVLCNYMNVYRQMIEDTLFGARVTTFCKQSTNPVEQLSSERLAQLFAEGISFLTYFGHSSANTLEFNIDNPESYNNQGKYPVFFVNGCNAGNFFTYNAQRMQINETLSEKFVLAKQKGTIAFVASTHYGIVNYLNLFLTNLYHVIGRVDFDKTLGETQRDAMQAMINAAGPLDFYARMHAEEITLNGDPAIYLNEQKKPDYIVEAQSVQINPAFISIAENNFKLKIRMVNVGKAVRDSIVLDVKRQLPNGSVVLLYRQKIPGIRYADSITLEVPLTANEKGRNKIIVTIDADDAVNEITESNNSTEKEFDIYEDEARPVYPFTYAIVNNPGQKLYASTANPFSAARNYVVEVDTTEAYNSSLKVSKVINSKGGVLEIDPGITYLDSTVYYWRVSIAPESGGQYQWSTSSFIYINGSSEGFEQGHFYQHLKSDMERLTLDSASRNWQFGVRNNSIRVKTSSWGTAASEEDEVSVIVNDVEMSHNACAFQSIVFHVFDPVTLRPWRNETDGSGNGKYGTVASNCFSGRDYNFEFRFTDTASRARMREFMDNIIPDGSFVVARSFLLDPVQYYWYPQAFANDWMKDTTYYGPNNSIYHKFLQYGFTEVDSFSRPRQFIFVYKKNDTQKYRPIFKLSQGTFDDLSLITNFITPDTIGYIKSPKFGPAKKWKDVIWKGQSTENPTQDNPNVQVIGIAPDNSETVLYTMDRNTHNLDISSVVPEQYPYMRLQMRNADSVNLTPYQLAYWNIHFNPAPEGAVAPNLYLVTKDTLDIGETLKFGIAFKNVSKDNFDSIKVKATVVDNSNVTHTLFIRKQKPIISGDTIKVEFELSTLGYSGNNTLFIDVNPDNDQPELYLFNNFVYRNFYVRPDNINPLLDVTFDGVHILNRDIVSAKPHIQIKLKDEAKYMLLNDTTLSSVEIRDPYGQVRTYNFDGDTLRFIPATSGSDNTATIDFTPQFTGQKDPEGDEYELTVKGKDKSGNRAGTVEYRVTFRVITKSMISNMLNYPNPFSTSTAFVFTLTGSEIPQNIRIQILTVTGKIVREITMNELGPLHIGRNITEFKWDGTDQYGQKLANGVYLYRVITSMNGSPLEKYKAKDDNTAKYFNNGYGKMYLMR